MTDAIVPAERIIYDWADGTESLSVVHDEDGISIGQWFDDKSDMVILPPGQAVEVMRAMAEALGYRVEALP